MIRTVLFDLDGTLAPSLDLWLLAFQRSLALYGQEHPEEYVISKCFYRDLEDIVSDFSLPCVTTFRSQLWRELEQAFEAAILFDHVPEMLQELSQSGFTIGLVTSSRTHLVTKVLASLDIARYFGTVVTADDVVNHKPHPDPVLLALKQLNGKAYETLMVGDSLADIGAGKNAGTQTALFFPEIHHRFYDRSVLFESAPDHTFTNHRELLRILASKSTLPLHTGTAD